MTRAREVWRHLVEQYVVSNAVRPRLERPISLYSSLELEALLLRWMSAHRALNAKTFQTAREREFKITDAHRVHLGAGGRWLFVASSKAGITYYDLDSDSSESPSGVELIPNQIAHTCPSWVQVTIEDDMQSPFVGFSVAFALSSHEYSTGATENWHHFQIWRVEAVLDGMQRVIGLKATQIASFPHIHRIAPHCSISLRGPHLAFHVMAAREYYVCVVDWRQANSLPSKYPFRVAQRASFPSVFLSLLPRNQLLAVSDYYYLCDYSSNPEFTCIPDQNIPLIAPYLRRTETPLVTVDPSNWFLDRTGTKATIIVFGGEYSSDWTLSALTFDCTSPSTGALVPKADLMTNIYSDDLHATYLGSKFSVFIDEDNQMTIVSYPSFAMEGNHDVTQRRGVLSHPCHLVSKIFADEDIGRIVYWASDPALGKWRKSNLTVVDFARESLP